MAVRLEARLCVSRAGSPEPLVLELGGGGLVLPPWQGLPGPERQVTGKAGWGRRWEPPGSGDPAGGPGFMVSHPHCSLALWEALATCCVGSKVQTSES